MKNRRDIIESKTDPAREAQQERRTWVRPKLIRLGADAAEEYFEKEVLAP